MKRLFLLLVLCLPVGAAQSLGNVGSLADLLPAESFLVLGAQDVAAHQDKLAPFIAEFEHLELGAALSAVFAAEGESASEGEAENPLSAVPNALDGLGTLDILGQDAWIAVSATPFNPLPAVTLAATVSAEASLALAEIVAETVQAENLEPLSEGGYTFFQQALEDPESPVQVLAFAQEGDTLFLSTNPDTLRGVLRQLGGSSDPAFTSSEGYAATLAELDAANFVGYLDYAQVVNVISPFAQGLGFNQLVERLSEAFTTAGVAAGAVRVTEDGLESESVQRLDPAGGDEALISLLSTPVAAEDTLELAPDSALSVSTAATDLGAWWDYLNGIAASTPELGGSLDELSELFLGVNLRDTVFSWLGANLTTITTGVAEAVEPGVAASNLLGETVYVLASEDEAAAVSGLEALFTTAGAALSSFTNPSGEADAAEASVSQVAGLNVTTYRVADGVELSYAVTDGAVYLATTPSGLEAVLTGDASLTSAPLAEPLLALVPEGASAVTLTDNQQTLQGTAAQIASQVQLSAGLGGASQLDFAAVDEASEKLEQFLGFVAERLGFSVAYTERGETRVYSYGKTLVTW